MLKFSIKCLLMSALLSGQVIPASAQMATSSNDSYPEIQNQRAVANIASDLRKNEYKISVLEKLIYDFSDSQNYREALSLYVDFLKSQSQIDEVDSLVGQLSNIKDEPSRSLYLIKKLTIEYRNAVNTQLVNIQFFKTKYSEKQHLLSNDVTQILEESKNRRAVALNKFGVLLKKKYLMDVSTAVGATGLAVAVPVISGSFAYAFAAQIIFVSIGAALLIIPPLGAAVMVVGTEKAGVELAKTQFKNILRRFPWKSAGFAVGGMGSLIGMIGSARDYESLRILKSEMTEILSEETESLPEFRVEGAY